MLKMKMKTFYSLSSRAEKVQEIQAWLKAHPVSSSSRASCDLQILDAGIVEKIEEELEKTKVETQKHLEPQGSSFCYKLHVVFSSLGDRSRR